jgi:spore maturation protein CgeB
VKDIDILFIGSAYKNRFITLDYVARYAELNNWNLQIYGPLFKEHFWKNIKNKAKYSHLIKYLHNVVLSSEEAASLYKRSKICLNIHTSHHRGINPRTFEILATNSFELIDERDDYAGIVEPGKDLIPYRSDEELVELIGHYLASSDERVLIARNGFEKVNERWSMETCLNNILS